MEFKLTHDIFGTVEYFTELTAPTWLSEGGRKDSTMCNRWFFQDYVLKMKIGDNLSTEFRNITRIR